MDFFTNKRVLVTGAGGFIGSHLVEELVKRGAIVKAFIRYTSRGDIGLLKYLNLIREPEIIYGDLRDKWAVFEAVKNVDIIFHLGAVISVAYSYVHPEEVIDVNTRGTLNILHAVKEYKTENVVYVSTSEVFGNPRYVPIDEDHPKRAQSPYAASKIAADEIVRSFNLSYGMNIKTVRPFNTYGPGQSLRAVIPWIIYQALNQDVVYLGNIHTKRDFTYVTDTVKGILMIAERGPDGGELNLGTGTSFSIREIVEMVSEIMGKNLKIIEKGERKRPEDSDIVELVSSNKKARELLGWEPEIDFREGLKLTIEWMGLHKELYEREII